MLKTCHRGDGFMFSLEQLIVPVKQSRAREVQPKIRVTINCNSESHYTRAREMQHEFSQLNSFFEGLTTRVRARGNVEHSRRCYMRQIALQSSAHGAGGVLGPFGASKTWPAIEDPEIDTLSSQNPKIVGDFRGPVCAEVAP